MSTRVSRLRERRFTRARLCINLSISLSTACAQPVHKSRKNRGKHKCTTLVPDRPADSARQVLHGATFPAREYF